MKRPMSDYALEAPAARKWGLPVIRLWGCAEQPALPAAASSPPQAAAVTVIHVHIHAPVPISTGQGGRIIQATPQRGAIATEGEPE